MPTNYDLVPKKKTISRKELMMAMRCGSDEIDGWVADGMPNFGKNAFNLHDCQEWFRIGSYYQQLYRSRHWQSKHW